LSVFLKRISLLLFKICKDIRDTWSENKQYRTKNNGKKKKKNKKKGKR